MSNRRTPIPTLNIVRAFSLVEVLIAVLILALGLLGLGAVFPVIVREQKIGNDVIIGTLAGNSARAMLQGWDIGAASGAGPDYWREAREALIGNDPMHGIPFAEGAWLPQTIKLTELHTGDAVFPDPTNGVLPIPMKMRLYPLDTRAAQPQFVWDLAIQRIPDGGGDTPTAFDAGRSNDDLQVAIFVRRIDGRIRLPRGVPLYRALTHRDAGLPASAHRVPVAVDQDGLPTYDGVGGNGTRPEYAQILTIPIEFDYDPAGSAERRRRDRLYPESSTIANSVEWRLARQPNQKLIDNLGTVYTVLEAGEDGSGREFIRVSPEVPASVTDNTRIRQVAFTPQVAAAIVTWRVTP